MSDPREGDGSPVRAVRTTSGSAIEFPVAKAALDLEYVVQVTYDFEDWIEAAIYTATGSAIERDAATETVQESAVDEGEAVRVIERLSTNFSLGYLRVLIRER